MKRFRFSGLIIALISILIFTMPALAITPTIKLMRITNNGDTALDFGSYLTPFDTQGLVDADKLGADGLDARLTSVTGGDPLPMMLTNNKVLTVASLSSYGTASLYFTTNHDAAGSMPIIVGNNGYFTTNDNPALELGSSFRLEIIGLINTTSDLVTPRNILLKDKAIRIYIYEDQSIRVAILDNYGHEVCTATATGVDTNEHDLTITGDGSHLSIAIDGGEAAVSEESIGAGVPDNDNPYIWNRNNVMPYISSITVTNGSGTPFVNFTGLAYDDGYIYAIESDINHSTYSSDGFKVIKFNVASGEIDASTNLPTGDNLWFIKVYVFNGNVYAIGQDANGFEIAKYSESDLSYIAEQNYTGYFMNYGEASSCDGATIYVPCTNNDNTYGGYLSYFAIDPTYPEPENNYGLDSYTSATGIVTTRGKVVASIADPGGSGSLYVMFLYYASNVTHLIKLEKTWGGVDNNWTLPYNSASTLALDSDYIYEDTGGSFVTRTDKITGTTTSKTISSSSTMNRLAVAGTNLYIGHWYGSDLLEVVDLTNWAGATSILEDGSNDDQVAGMVFDGYGTLYVSVNQPDPDTYQYMLGNNIYSVDLASLTVPTISNPLPSGSMILGYQPHTIIEGDVLPDLAGNQDATIHWGLNDPNFSFSEFVPPTKPAVATPGSPGAGPGIGGGNKPITKVQTGTWTLPSLNPPLIGDLINSLLDSTVFGRAFFWYPVALMILLVAKFWAYRLTFSLFMKMMSGIVAVIALCAFSLLPWLSLPLFFIWDFTIMTHSQRGAL